MVRCELDKVANILHLYEAGGDLLTTLTRDEVCKLAASLETMADEMSILNREIW